MSDAQLRHCLFPSLARCSRSLACRLTAGMSSLCSSLLRVVDRVAKVRPWKLPSNDRIDRLGLRDKQKGNKEGHSGRAEVNGRKRRHIDPPGCRPCPPPAAGRSWYDLPGA